MTIASDVSLGASSKSGWLSPLNCYATFSFDVQLLDNVAVQTIALTDKTMI